MMGLNSQQLHDCFNVALELSKKAGDVIRSTINKKKKIETKSSAVDLVTESDKAVEELLKDGLLHAFPNHHFIGEESVSAGEKCHLTDAPTWIIDPIDGTMNFVHSFPYVCISIGLWVEKRAEIGIVYNPVLEQMFTAQRNRGAYLNSERIHVSEETDLSQALVICEMGTSHVPEKTKCVLANIEMLLPRVHGIRGLGSAALAMCTVAAGWGDAFYHFGLQCWDVAAGALIIEEAGGCVADTKGGPLDLMSRRILCASSQKIAQELATLLHQYQPERD